MRKIILIVITFIATNNFCDAQTYILLDRTWQKPAILTDTITKEHLNKGLYPIYKSDIDTLIILVGEFKNLNKSGLNRQFFNAENFKTDRFEFLISNFKRAYGDSYDVTMVSYTGSSKTILKLSDPTQLNPVNQQTVRQFLSYLKETKKLINKPAKKKK